MLDAGRAPRHESGLILFHDHAEEHRFYVAPEVPRIALREGTPGIDLTLFRGDVQGGLLQMEVSVTTPEEKLRAAEEALMSVTGRTPELIRPAWRDGVFRLSGWLATDELEPLVLHTGRPSLVGDPKAVVAARLDAAGAALADGSLRGNALPVVALFELETLGLAGALQVTAEADLHAIHERLTLEGALTTPVAGVKVRATWETLFRENLIRIDVHDESGDTESDRAEALRRIGEDLVLMMLSAQPPKELPPQLDDQPIAPVELSFRLTARREELATTAFWDFSERRAVPIRHRAAGSLLGLFRDGEGEGHIHHLDLGEIPSTVRLRTEPELEAMGIAALEVDLRWPGGGDPSDTVVLTREHVEEVVPLPLDPDSGGVEVRPRARFDPEVTAADDRLADWTPLSGRFHLLSPRLLFPSRSLSIVTGRGELDWIDHVQVDARVGDGPTRSVLLDPETLSATLHFPGADDDDLFVTSHWRGVGDEPSRSVAPQIVEGILLAVDSPFAPSLKVLVVPLPLDDSLGMGAEFALEHGDLAVRHHLWWDAGDKEPRRLSLRRLLGAPDTYRFRTSVLWMDGSIEQSDWSESDASTVVLGTDESVEVHRTRVIVLGGGPRGRGSLVLELLLASGEAETRKIVEGDTDVVEMVLVTPEEASPPSLLAREHFDDGRMTSTRFDPAESTIVLVPPPEPT